MAPYWISLCTTLNKTRLEHLTLQLGLQQQLAEKRLLRRATAECFSACSTAAVVTFGRLDTPSSAVRSAA
jgi:hypothetical protein